MGKVTSMRLLAAPDMPPPVAEVVKPTTYWVRAPAARDGFVLSTVTGGDRAGGEDAELGGVDGLRI